MSQKDSDWTRGRDHFLVFLIRIADETLAMRISEIQGVLSTNPCFDPFPKDYFHITVKGCGFPVRSAERENDIPVENIQRIVIQTGEVLQSVHPFSVVLSKLNIFRCCLSRSS